MRIPLLLPALLLAAGIARADVVIVQKVDGAGQSGQMTVSVGDSKVRTDISPQMMSTITDITTGDVTTLMHAQKAYMVIPAAASKAMIQAATRAMTQASGAAIASPAPPKASGRTDKINGYNAAEYTFSNGALKASYWMSADFPNAKMVNDALAKVRKGGLADITKAFAPDMSTLPGVPVRTEVEINGQKIVTELVSATEQKVDPAQYAIPAGYTEMKLPTAPGQ